MSNIDDGFYSRQLYVLGKEAMHQLFNARVLISGLRGLGVEIAKNIILCGVKSVIIQDCDNVTYDDLSSQFYLTEDDIGKNRAQVTYSKLSELNKNVELICSSDSLTEYFIHLNHIDVLILTNATEDEQFMFSDYCHRNRIKFLIANTKGLFGQIFCDFGENFEVLDTNGEKPKSHFVTDISRNEKSIVSVAYERHHFEDGSYVTFDGIEGMTEVNGKEFRVHVINSDKFSIGDTTAFHTFENGGKVIEVKKSEIIHFKSYIDCLNKPDLSICDYNKMSMSSNLHLAFQAFFQFKQKYQTIPKPWNDIDAEKFYELAYLINMKNRNEPLTDDLNKHWIKLFSKTCAGDLCPIQSIIGSIASQEIIKAITGKFMPIKQFFYFDGIECLPEDILQYPETTTSIEKNLSSQLEKINKQSRYYSQEIIFGKNFQENLGKLKNFLIGAGAIGCEILKNFSMMGVACEKDGFIYLSDTDIIEKSNLNRHFLFRTENIGEMKSDRIIKSISNLNRSIYIETFNYRVDEKNEHIFNEKFFDKLDFVIDATDNNSTHKYIDNQCVYYKRPLIINGTLGLKSNVQVVLPMKTESYCSQGDPPEYSVPLDVIKNFPHSIEHTIEWARNHFLEIFKEEPEQANEYINNQIKFAENISKNYSDIYQNSTIQKVENILGSDRPKTFNDCIRWARNLFDNLFEKRIKKLLAHFPHDDVMNDGQRFWIEHKICPHPVQFNSTNKTHLDFIIAASNLRAQIYNIPTFINQYEIIEQLNQIEFFQIEIENDNINQNQNFEFDAKTSTLFDKNQNENDLKINKILSLLPKLDQSINENIKSHDFKLEDESNFQLDYIVATANLRAENYQIQMAERTEVLRIAARINPSIVTTSALIGGIISLEIYKFVQQHKQCQYYKNSCINMNLPLFMFYELAPPKRRKYLDQEFTEWDRFEIKGDFTLEQFIEYFQKEYKLVIDFISSGLFIIYARYLPKSQLRTDDLKRKISQIYERVTNKQIDDNIHSIILQITCDDLQQNGIEDLPFVKYTFQ